MFADDRGGFGQIHFDKGDQQPLNDYYCLKKGREKMSVNHIQKLKQRGWTILHETDTRCWMTHPNEAWIAVVSTAWGDITWEEKTDELIDSIKPETK